MTANIDHILVCGSGLAFEFVLARMANALSDTIKLTALEIPDPVENDAIYGTTTTPAAYRFFLDSGLDEPELITRSSTGFSFGTQYKNWGGRRHWVQGFQLPFPIWNGVPFHHFLSGSNQNLETFMPGAAAGRAGRFAHPPNDKNIILSRAEYGYQFDPFELAELLKNRLPQSASTGLMPTLLISNCARPGLKKSRYHQVKLLPLTSMSMQVVLADFFCKNWAPSSTPVAILFVILPVIKQMKRARL